MHQTIINAYFHFQFIIIKIINIKNIRFIKFKKANDIVKFKEVSLILPVALTESKFVNTK